jgi:alkaline phosphatase D
MRRREFIVMAGSFGATLAWRAGFARGSKIRWQERRDLYPHGVASGDPDSESVILWTRRPPAEGVEAHQLTLEVAEDAGFARIVATGQGRLSAETDWTCRVLASRLKPAKVYWYRFTDEYGFGSRVGRTITAPLAADTGAVHFAFVSCQNVQQGASNAYRRMIWEDERKTREEQLSFVLHLGDFIYEIVWYPEDRPQGMYARRLRDIVRYANGEKIEDFHIPTTTDDYRAVYRAYLLDPDLQDARARWPFICMWDNHEFSWKGWQTQQNFGGVRPAQTRKVAAGRVWFEYQPARIAKSGKGFVDGYEAPRVKDAPIRDFDENGMGLESGNLAVVRSLKLFRTFRWGRHVELILTDNRTFRSEPLMDHPEVAAFRPKGFPFVTSEDVTEVLDAGKTYNGGKPPETIRFDGEERSNFRKNAAPQSMLGGEQKAWFLGKLGESTATWKLWGNSVAMLDWRADFQNLPEAVGAKWPTTGYAQFTDDDWSGYRSERAEILNFVRKKGITGFATIAGDRHAFTAGLLSATLPPRGFDPVGVEFVTGSISAPALFEAAEYRLPKDHPLRAVYLYQASAEAAVQPAVNLTMLHGVRASLALQKTGRMEDALAVRNPENAPHLSFVDVGGHGYCVVRASGEQLEVEFVCIPRPLERSAGVDGGPLAYRVVHRAKRWAPGTAPRLERTRVEGTLPLIP